MIGGCKLPLDFLVAHSGQLSCQAPATASVVEGGIPVYFNSGGHDLIGIVAGSDGALWFTNESSGIYATPSVTLLRHWRP